MIEDLHPPPLPSPKLLRLFLPPQLCKPEARDTNRHAYSFFEQAQRIVRPDYLPNEMDVLRARTKTTGIYETRFQMGQLSIQ